jgi:Chaperone of endosialidase
MRKRIITFVVAATFGLADVPADRATAMPFGNPAGIRVANEKISTMEPVHCRRYVHRHRWGHGWGRGCRIRDRGTHFRSRSSFIRLGRPRTHVHHHRIHRPHMHRPHRSHMHRPHMHHHHMRPGGGRRRSDIRLKHDIVLLQRLGNGLALYSFRYLWSDRVYVGVMAQEVQAVRPDAVLRGGDGFLRVDYGRLGMRIQTWDEWIALPRRETNIPAP